MAGSLVTEPLFYLLAVPVVLWVGVSKGGFGGGGGMVAVPLLSLAVPLPQAAGILLPILCAMDLFAVAAYRGQHDATSLRRLLPAALVGITAGALAFDTLDDRWLRLVVGAIAVAFALRWVLGAVRGARRAPVARNRGAVSGAIWGSVAGFTSTLAHAGDPPVAMYLLPQRLAPRVFAGTMAIVFAVMNHAKLVPYAWLGQLRAGNLLTSLVLLPLAPLGVLFGRWLHERVDDVLFYRVTYVLLLVTGLQLIAEGLG